MLLFPYDTLQRDTNPCCVLEISFSCVEFQGISFLRCNHSSVPEAMIYFCAFKVVCTDFALDNTIRSPNVEECKLLVYMYKRISHMEPSASRLKLKRKIRIIIVMYHTHCNGKTGRMIQMLTPVLSTNPHERPWSFVSSNFSSFLYRSFILWNN